MNLWRLFGVSHNKDNDEDVLTLLDDFARLSIDSSKINNPARGARRLSPKWRILFAGLVTLVVTGAVSSCLQQPHEPLQIAPALFSASHIAAVSNEFAEVHRTARDPLQTFSASLGSAESALHSTAIPHSLLSAVQPASNVQPALGTGAATEREDCTGTETVPTAPSGTHTEAGASEFAEARTVHADSEANCLQPAQTATAASDTNAAAMQCAEIAAASSGDANITLAPVLVSTPGPQPLDFSLALGTSTNVFHAIVEHSAADAPHRKLADDIAAAASAFNPPFRWRVQGSTPSAPDTAEADSPEFKDVLLRLPVRLKQQAAPSSDSKLATAVAATAEVIEASASVAALEATEEFVCTKFCDITG